MISENPLFKSTTNTKIKPKSQINMRFPSILLLIVSAFIFTNCGNKTENKAVNDTTTSSESTTYTYSSDSTYVGFVAYKFNEKVGVPGWFKDFSASGVPATVTSPKELLNDLSFSIPVEALETGVEDRNQKIKEHFFGTINTDSLKGKVIEVQGNATSGTAKVEIYMNGITKVADLAYNYADNVFQLKGTIDVSIWDALSGIKALNTACDILHKGADGVSKLWPTVDLDIKTTLQEIN